MGRRVALLRISTPLGEGVLLRERLAERKGISPLCESARPWPQSYRVKWNETDFDYLSRRFAEAGCFIGSNTNPLRTG